MDRSYTFDYLLTGMNFPKLPRVLILSLIFIFFKTEVFSQGPQITYTPLSNTCSKGSRDLIATITDADGVPVSGTGLPVLYWKINSEGTYFSTTGVSMGLNQYKFSFGATADTGTVVYYYIAAQDSLANTSVSPSGGESGFSSNPPAVAVPPTNLNYYIIQRSISSGSYLVGASQPSPFNTLVNAINAYNTSCSLNGPITFLLTDAIYNLADTTLTINSHPLSSSTNTLTIKPSSSVNTIITGTSEAVIKFLGADYIIIDGSNAGTTSRNLTIKNTSTSFTSTVIWLSSFSSGNGSTNNVIKNCNISGNSSSTTFSCVALSSSSIVNTSAEFPNSRNTIQNNNIYTAYQGIYINGAELGDDLNVISGNIVGSATLASKIGYRAISIINQINISINNNNILGVSSAVLNNGEIDASAGVYVGGSIIGGNVYANIIRDIVNTNANAAPSHGISLQSVTDVTGMKIYNNFIYAVTAYGSSSNIPNNGYGIAIILGGGYGIYYNSVHLTTNQTVAGYSASIYFGSTATSGMIDVKNNIFSNRQTTGIAYSIYCNLTSSIFSSINYNDYYGYRKLGFINAADKLDLGDWQLSTGSDGNSVSVNPLFVSTTDLHLQDISPLNNQGLSITGITTDIDGATRATPPDIGADDFSPPACTSSLGGTAAIVSSTVFCVSGAPELTCTSFSSGGGMLYQWESSTDNTSWSSISGETNPTYANPTAINVNTYFRLKAVCNGGTPGYSNVVLVQIKNPQITSTTPNTRCGNGTLQLAATGNPETTVQWYTNSTGGVPLASGNIFTTPSITNTTTYYAEPAYIGSGGSCGPVSPFTMGGTVNVQNSIWKVYFNVKQATTIVSVDIFPHVSGESFRIDIKNSAGQTLWSVPFTTLVSGGATAQTIPLNAFIFPGNQYSMVINAGLSTFIGSYGFTRNNSGANYPYSSSDIEITGNEYNSTYFLCFYNWKFTTGCVLGRTPVIATVDQPIQANVTASESIVCQGDSITLTASSNEPNYSYTWMPGNLSGSNVRVAPTETTTFYLTASTGVCTTNGTVTVNVQPKPNSLIISPVSISRCYGSSLQQITASASTVDNITILSEDFNDDSRLIPSGWWDTISIINNAGRWTGRPNNYTYSNSSGDYFTFKSNDSSRFFLTNSSNISQTYTATLKTPLINLTGFASAKLYFWHCYKSYDGRDAFYIDKNSSPTGSTWTPIYGEVNNHSTPVYIGSSSRFVLDSVDLTGYINTSFYIRFRYQASNQLFWAIDNVRILGKAAPQITWSPTSGLFTSATGNPPPAYNGLTSTSVWANPTSTTTYVATVGTSINRCVIKDSSLINIYPLVSATLSPNTSICAGDTTNLYLTLTGTSPWTFTFKRTSLQDSIITSFSTPLIIPVSPSATTTYSITNLSDIKNCSSSSALSTTVSILQKPLAATITTASSTSPTTICENSSINLKIVVTTPNSASLGPYRVVYTSFRRGASLPDTIVLPAYTNSASFSVTLTDTTDFKLISVQASNGCIFYSSSSLTVNAVKMPFSGSISGAGVVCPGTNSTLLTLSGYIGTGIQWQFSTDNNNFINISNQTASTYTANNLTQTTYYKAIISTSVCSTSVSTGVVQILVNPLPSAVVITQFPTTALCENQNSTVNKKIVVSFTSSGVSGPFILVYSKKVFGATDSTIYTIYNYTSGDSIPVSPTDTTTYRVLSITGANGCAFKPTANSVVTFYISEMPVVGTITTTTPSINCSSASNVTLTLSGCIGRLIQWKKSLYNDTTWALITTAPTSPNSSITISQILATNYYHVVVKNQACTDTTSNLVIYIHPGVVIGGGVTICAGSNNTLQAVGYIPGSSFQWQKSTTTTSSSFADIIGETLSSYTATNITQTTYYRVKITPPASSGCSVAYVGSSTTPSYTTITVNSSAISSGTISGRQSLCGAGADTLTLSGYTPGVTIQWQSSSDNTNYTNINGATATSSQLIIPLISSSTYYRALVTTSSGGCNGNAYTTGYLVSVYSTPAPGTITANSTSICSGSSINLTLNGYTNGASIQWQTSIDNITFANISGQTSSTYTPVNLIQSTYYRAVVTSGVCTSATTSSVLVTVSPQSVSGTISGAAIVCSGTNSTLLTLNGSTGSVQWQSSINNSTFNDITGQTSTTLTAVNLTQTTYYRVVVTSGVCSSATTSSVTVTVNPQPVAGSISGASTVCSGTNSTLLTLSGATGSIQWQSSSDNTTYSDIVGQTSSTYTAANLIQSTYYRVVVTSGVCTSTTTSSVLVAVSPQTVSGTISGAATVCSGTNSTLLTLNGSTGSVQWQSSINNSTFNNITGQTSSTFTAVNLTQTTYYRVVVTSGVCSSATTSSVTVTVNPQPVAGSISGASTVCSGTNSTLLTLSGTTGEIQWQSSTNNITFTDISGQTSLTYTAVNINQTIYYQAVLTSGICGTSTTGVFTLGIATKPTATISGNALVCSGSPAILQINVTGIGPWNGTLSDGTTFSGNTSPLNVPVTPISGGTSNFTIATLNDSRCSATSNELSGSASIRVFGTAPFTDSCVWIGKLSTSWNDAGNWCGGIPSSGKSIVVPSGLSFYPIITDTLSSVNSMLIESSASVVVNAGGKIKINGDLLNSGSFLNNGTVAFVGDRPSQNITISSATDVVTSMDTIEINKSAGTINLNNKVTVKGSLRLYNGSLNLHDTIVMASVSSGTANIDAVGDDFLINYIGAAGCFSVERYIPTGISHGKSWQLLSTPTIGQTVNEAWQEGASSVSTNPKPGYGTTITSNLSNAIALGFDLQSFAPSMKVFNDLNNSYDGIPNTTIISITNPKGYMLFVRGDRTVTSFNQEATPLTLRTTGRIFYPHNPPSSLNVMPGKFQSIGNPYASTIDFVKLQEISTGIVNYYYVWDPLYQGSYGLGAFQTISPEFGAVPGGTINYPTGIPYSEIQSGQAFFVKSNTGGAVNFSESIKIKKNRLVMRSQHTNELATLRLTMKNPDNTIADGNLLAIDRIYSNELGEDDAVKISNIGENLGIKESNQILSIDTRLNINDNDTIWYYLSNLRTQRYKLIFEPANFNSLNLTARLIDRYNSVAYPLSLEDSSSYFIDVTAASGSRMSDRFCVVFSTLRPVSVNYISVSATAQAGYNQVDWKVTDQHQVSRYQIEKSADGLHFEKAGEKLACMSSVYHFDDLNPYIGDNFYRIEAISLNGEIQFSKIVKVQSVATHPSVIVSPNPIKDNAIKINFINMNSGIYQVKILDPLGRIVSSQSIKHEIITPFHTVQKTAALSCGVYLVEIIDFSGRTWTDKMIVK